MSIASEHRGRWRFILHSTEPADRLRAETGMRAFYAAAGFSPPAHLLWYASDCAASWALAALVPREDRTRSHLLAPAVLTGEESERLERARSELRDGLGVTSWESAEAAVGTSRSSAAQIGMDRRQTFAPVDFVRPL
jgi:hypothetical protein